MRRSRFCTRSRKFELLRPKPQGGFISEPRVSEAPPWVRDGKKRTLKGFNKNSPCSSWQTGCQASSFGPHDALGIIKPLQGLTGGNSTSQGGASLTLGFDIEPRWGSRAIFDAMPESPLDSMTRRVQTGVHTGMPRVIEMLLGNCPRY